MKLKFSLTTVLNVVGIALTLGGSLLSSISGDRKAKEHIAELVKEELAKK